MALWLLNTRINMTTYHSRLLSDIPTEYRIQLNACIMRYALIERCNRVTGVPTGMAPLFQQKIQTSMLLDTCYKDHHIAFLSLLMKCDALFPASKITYINPHIEFLSLHLRVDTHNELTALFQEQSPIKSRQSKCDEYFFKHRYKIQES